MESTRSFGNYDLALALADIIDNSITAGAKNIHIHANFDDDEIRISDDGSGMTREELIVAMRIGSKNPKEERSGEDLGRFGLGLKTASFSQADRLIVLTNKGGEISGAEWDLNNCSNFQMKVFNASETLNIVNSSISKINGTEIVWKELSRLRQGSKKEDEFDDFNRAVGNAIDEIGLIFHRFLKDDFNEANNNHIQIFFNNSPVKAVDPFCRSNSKTQMLSQNSEAVGTEAITFTPFTLPLFKELNSKEKEQLGGNEGFIKNSGFYIYRNRRLIIRGTWFKLVPFGELSKLSRIMVDIPNSLDEEWKITVDKSGVQLPGVLRKRLSSWLQNRVVRSSQKVFKGQGDKESMGIALWTYVNKQNVGKFILSEKHPIITNFLNKLDNVQTREFKKVINVVQSLLPIENIRNIVSDQPETVFQGYSDSAPKEVLQMAQEIALNMLNNGKTKTEILESLSIIQPFNQFYDDVEKHFFKEGLFER